MWNGSIAAHDNIIWGNIQNYGQPIVEGSGIANLTFSNIEGGFSGAGNINLDPLFADQNCFLLPNAPCIDAGYPACPLDPDGARTDMGTKFFPHFDQPYIRIKEYDLK